MSFIRVKNHNYHVERLGYRPFSAKEAVPVGKKAEQAFLQAKRKSFLRRLLLILLSTFPYNNQRRTCHRNLLTCLENKTFWLVSTIKSSFRRSIGFVHTYMKCIYLVWFAQKKKQFLKNYTT